MTVPETGKRRQKTAAEFGEALKTLIGKRTNKATMEYDVFKQTLAKMVV